MIRRTTQRGSAIAAATVMVVLLAGLTSALVIVSLPIQKNSAVFNFHVVCGYAAEGGLEAARYEIASSLYDDVGNEWLLAFALPYAGAAPTEPGADPPLLTLTIGRAAVEVWVYELDAIHTFYRVFSRATIGERLVVLAQDVRARDTFARYMFFVDADYINFGTTTVRGHVHINRHINFDNGGAHFYGDVSAVQGFNYRFGATQGNTTFHAAADPNASHINMPSVNEINALRPNAGGIFDVHNDNPEYGGSGILDAQIELLGGQVRVRAIRRTSGEVVRDEVQPMPANGLIFVQGDVTSIKGKSSKPLTVATMGRVDITDRITYVDEDGDPRYVLKQNGLPVLNNETPAGIAWTEADGFTYEENPAFDGPAANGPVVGIMAAQEVEIVNGAPYNMEMHAAVFSATKNWSANLGSSKGNLKVLGSLVSRKRGWRYTTAGGGLGYWRAGEYIYDEMLLQNPPPFWLPVDKPVWGARWRVMAR